MSYDLIFWKQSRPLDLHPETISERLSGGERKGRLGAQDKPDARI